MIPDLLSTRSCSSFFHDEYDLARAAWLRCVEESGPGVTAAGRQLTCLEIPHPLPGPHGELLATDVTWIGGQNTSQVIGFISATHGIEGYAGSAIQHFLLASIAADKLQLPESTAVLFIHALNPWGMAWHRRCDEQGIDVNRNFIDFNEPLPENPDYQSLRHVLSMTDRQQRAQQLNSWRLKIGETRYQIAMSGGQYTNPAHPFYGGNQQSFSSKVIDKIIDEFPLQNSSLIILDLHTGLGAWGYGELICDHPPNSTGEHYATTIFGDGLTFPQRGTSSSVPKLGLLDYRWHKLMNNTGCYLTLEFGTYSTDQLFNQIIDDHQRWSEGTDPLVAHGQSRADMLSHFAPDDVYWQQAVLFKAWQTAVQSIEQQKTTHD